MRVAIAGGTGAVGKYIVSALAAGGHEPVSLARATGVNIVTGQGLDAALVGVEAVIDVSNVTTMKRAVSMRFFEAGTTHLLEAGASAGVGHHVILSVVGIDRVDFGYYFGKRRQEELTLASGRPVSILRATQFYEFAGQLLDRARGPVAAVPRMLIQPVAAREVAGALVQLVAGPAVGMAPEMSGPETHELPELARAVLGARGSRKRVLPLRLPGAVGTAMKNGALIPTAPGPHGVQTFDEWLAELVPAVR